MGGRWLPVAVLSAVIIAVLAGLGRSFDLAGIAGRNNLYGDISSVFKETFGSKENFVGEIVAAPIAETVGSVGTVPKKTSVGKAGMAGPKNTVVAGSVPAASVVGEDRSEAVPVPVQKTCVPAGAAEPSRLVLINEVAWAGTASSTTAHEWIELKNVSSGTVVMSGWWLVNKTGSIDVRFTEKDAVSPGAFYLLKRSDDFNLSGAKANRLFSGAVKNSDETLRLFDGGCSLVDEVAAESGPTKAWPAGAASPDYRTAERSADFSWHAYSGTGNGGAFGTPKAENSPAVLFKTEAMRYSLVLQKIGNGAGTVTSSPKGIDCGENCLEDSEDFPAGTEVGLGYVLSAASQFSGWSGDCYGESCVLKIDGDKSVTASFYPKQSSFVPPAATAPVAEPNPSVSPLVSEIMVGAEANADYEFIELYNPGDTAVALTGWSIKKKSSSGTESSLVASSRLEGKIIPAGKYFLIVHSGSYDGPVAADAEWAASNSLAYANNSIVVYDNRGTKTEEVGWAEIPRGKSYARSVWMAGEFSVLDVPTPQNSLQ
jgi:hypothetical protein